MTRNKSTNESVWIESLRHKDKRKNIPTEELRDFVAEDEAKPKIVKFPGLLYSRDPSLDPQLVWKGKEEQDQEELAVPTVPVYIQEKIHPQAIIQDVQAQVKQQKPETQPNLFADFNGIEFEELVEFYRHEQNWANRMILGDSLLVMTSLAEKEGLKGKVQMIYVDPPYGIKFGSNWQVSTRKREVKNGRHEGFTRQPEQIRAFRDTWKIGIHSYLAYLRDRLVIARELLTETGSIFVQIGDENVHLVRSVMDEVFGSENFVSQIAFTKAAGGLESGGRLSARMDYLLWYAKNSESYKYRPLFEKRDDPIGAGFNILMLPDGSCRTIATNELTGDHSLPDGAHICMSVLMTKPGPGARYEVEFQGRKFDSGSRWWGMQKPSMERVLKTGRVAVFGNNIRFLRRADDFPCKAVSNLWDGLGGAADPIYVVQTSGEVIQRCLLMTTDPGDLVLDPTCGSGTTAYIAEQWGRRWITIDTSRVALALSRTRLMAAKYPYYLLADSSEGVRKEAEITGRVPPAPMSKTENDIKKGFVYKRVPHITLKSIANNQEIDGIHAKREEKLEPIRTELNRLLKQSWEEWQIPRKVEKTWPQKVKDLLAEWWRLRLERQKEIDAAIARHVDTEILYDQPYEDPKRIRVSGPFTVESLSPHRMLTSDEDRPVAERAAQREATVGQFETMILDNLRKAGVQNRVKSERLIFDRLEPYAGEWLHAAGEYADKDGAVRRVAVSIGPEHGTVGPEQVKEAAKEALRGAGFDLLVVCGFAFDAHAGETANQFSPDPPKKPNRFAVADATRQYGKLPVLLARMNPDLAMGDELLKKTGAGNLFMVFGEPDLKVTKQKDGRLVVEILGVDVYDPTTGQIRNSSTDDIACWFLDTDYNGESFFVRHAYFTGTDEPYDKLKRALRAEINEAAWSALYSTKSRPFDPPQTGKIAIKVINHYGDEVLKVYDAAGSLV